VSGGPHHSAQKPSPESVLAASEYWSGRAILLILAGVVLEVAELVAFPHDASSPEQWLRFVGIACIGAGLAIEYTGIRKAREASAEQRRESDDRLAAANQPAEAAKEDEPAPRASSEIAKLESSRSDDIKANAGSIPDTLKPFSDTCFDGALANNSGEQADLWWALKAALVAANWQQVTWTENGKAARHDSHPALAAVDAKNVEIHLHPETREKLLPAATALISALNNAGIAAADAGFNCQNANVDAIHIMIGDKR
jgi:hypothetical protein